MIRRHPLLALFTVAYLALVGWVTLGPQPLDGEGQALLWRALRFFARHEQTSWLDYSTVEFASNVLMFVPIGLLFLLLLDLRRWWLAVLLGVALTCGIEFTQQFLPTRVADPRDLLSNSIGAAIGVLVGLVWGGIGLLRDRAPSRRPAVAARG